jgi:carboxymethylenebutenolidase
MKKSILLALLFSFSQLVKAQSCCETVFAAADGNMAGFVSDSKFRDMHPVPVPYIHISEVGGTMISLSAPDNVSANAYEIKAKKKTNKWLFVYQEWWGLNEHIKKQADKFYADLNGEVNVLALDMYDGKVAASPEEAGKYMQSAKEARLEAIMNSGIMHAGKKAKIASVGWCFGGGLSLKSAILEGKQAVGCVMYYGMPVKDVEKLKTLSTDVLGLFATEQWISKPIIEEFAANMKTAGKSLDYKIYDAAHAFANPSNPKFDQVASEDAYSKTITYLKAKLK